MWLGSSVVRVLARCARGPGFESRSMCFFLPCDIWWPIWVHARAASSKGTVSSVPAWFRADSGTNLIKQGEIVTGRPCGLVAQWSECSHGVREVLDSSPGDAMCSFLPCDMCITHAKLAPVEPQTNVRSDAKVWYPPNMNFQGQIFAMSSLRKGLFSAL